MTSTNPPSPTCQSGRTFRNATFAGLRDELDGLRLCAYAGWLRYGPGTTREVAQKCGMDILTFRPRTTELLQMGLLLISDIPHAKLDTRNSREGRYRAAQATEWEGWHQIQVSRQLQLI